MHRVSKRTFPILFAAVVVLTACTPPGSGQSTPPGAADRPARPKVLTIAANRELNSWTDLIGLDQGHGMLRALGHNYLSIQDDQGAWSPQLATEMISAERGTWVVNPDGSMVTTWRIHPNIKWHDGTPFTAEDLVFAWRLHTDRDLPFTGSGGSNIRLMSSATAQDPHTLVINWSRTFVNADRALGLHPLPKHLMEESYLRDKDAFTKSTLHTSDWVGLGPYKIVRWDQGIEYEFAAFDEYFRGRPPVERLFVRIIRDGNTMIANILSAEVDMVFPPSVDLDLMKEVEQRWAGTGHQTVALPQLTRLRNVAPQHRPEYAEIKDLATNVMVRRALYHGVNRQQLADVVGQGYSPPADSGLHPSDPTYPLVRSAIPQHPYDPALAQRMLAEQGWVKGGDGVLVHQTTGQRFQSTLFVRPTVGAEKDAAIVVDGWKQLGVDLGIHMIPPALSDDRPTISTYPSLALKAGSVAGEICSAVSGPANSWSGGNTIGYCNPRVDETVDRLNMTIDPTQRVELTRTLWSLIMGDVMAIPLYFETQPLFMLKGVTFSRDSFQINKG